MKKFFAMFFVFCLLLSLGGCATRPQSLIVVNGVHYGIPDRLMHATYRVDYVYEAYQYTGEDDTVVIEDEINGYPVVALGNAIFEDSEVIKVTVGKNVADIGYAFERAETVETVEINGPVTKLDADAFIDCKSLKNISLPETLESIGALAFYGCSSLETIGIPDGVTFIDNMAFAYCGALREVKLPDGLTQINPWTFGYCVSLERVEFGANITVIGESAFSSCDLLSEIVYGGTMAEWENIEKGKGWDCTKNDGIYYPHSYTVHCTDGDIEANA